MPNTHGKLCWAVKEQALLFVNFSTENFADYKSAYHTAAGIYTEKNINFLLGDFEASHGAFEVITSSRIPFDSLI